VAKLTVGQKLKKLRESVRVEHTLTQAELAELAGVSKQRIYQWENDQRGLTLEAARKLASALGCKVSDLVD
jgi:repressor LexA